MAKQSRRDVADTRFEPSIQGMESELLRYLSGFVFGSAGVSGAELISADERRGAKRCQAASA